jgi:hypothetical protein
MVLHIACKKLPHPYPEELSSVGDIWAEIILQVRDTANQLVRTVFHIQWDLTVLAEWLTANRDDLVTEEMPGIEKETSVAKSIFNFYEHILPDEENDALMDSMYTYRASHGLRFAFRGVDLDDIYIGLFEEKLTISAVAPEEWSYEIDRDAFLNSIQVVQEQLFA